MCYTGFEVTLGRWCPWEVGVVSVGCVRCDSQHYNTHWACTAVLMRHWACASDNVQHGCPLAYIRCVMCAGLGLGRTKGHLEDDHPGCQRDAWPQGLLGHSFCVQFPLNTIDHCRAAIASVTSKAFAPARCQVCISKVAPGPLATDRSTAGRL